MSETEKTRHLLTVGDARLLRSIATDWEISYPGSTSPARLRAMADEVERLARERLAQEAK